MELKEIVLNEVASEYGYADWRSFDDRELPDTRECALWDVIPRLDKVMRWASLNGWVLVNNHPSGNWNNAELTKKATDAELYELFKSQSE